MFGEIQPAVKKETKKVIIYTLTGIVLMWIVFAVLHGTMPEKVPFDYTVILGGLGGGAVAVLNFFLDGTNRTEGSSCEDEGSARMRLKASYSQRMLLQLGWGIAAIIAPCFQFAGGTFTASVPFHGDQAECDF